MSDEGEERLTSADKILIENDGSIFRGRYKVLDEIRRELFHAKMHWLTGRTLIFKDDKVRLPFLVVRQHYHFLSNHFLVEDLAGDCVVKVVKGVGWKRFNPWMD